MKMSKLEDIGYSMSKTMDHYSNVKVQNTFP